MRFVSDPKGKVHATVVFDGMGYIRKNRNIDKL